MSIADRIERIIARRQPRIDKIAAVETSYESLADRLGDLDRCRDRLLGRVKDPENRDRLSSLPLTALVEKIGRQRQALTKLKDRLSRQTLNIGVVGETGAGKSTLLKSISGLTDEEIPAGEGGACTAVRSTIENQQGEIKAEVTFHSEKSFLREVISPYYQELGLGPTPKTLDEFADRPFPLLPPSGAMKEKMYNHLRDDYYQPLSQYRHLFQPQVRKIAIARSAIPNYATQKRDDRGQLTTFSHLAVKEVKIFCPFNRADADAGKIALVDVPGMGDTRLGDEKLMLETLGKEVDVVIFVHRPDSKRYLWKDYSLKLYENAGAALPDLSRRAFMVLNHDRSGHNLKACQALQQNLDTIKVVECAIADCADSQDTEKLLDVVLNYLTREITDLDDRYAAGYQSEVNKIQAEVSMVIEKARRSRGEELSPAGEYRRYRELFRELWKDLVVGLNALLKELKTQPLTTDEAGFQAKIQVAIANCQTDTGIPSIPDIEVRQEVEGGYMVVYGKYLNELRAHLLQKFAGLDEVINDRVEAEKTLVTDVLANQGKLGAIASLKNRRGAAFLQAIAQQVLDDKSKLKQPLQSLANFEISHQLNFQEEIQKQMDDLHPNTTKFRLGPNPSAEEVEAYLKANYQKAVAKCEEVLQDLSGQPTQEAFGAIKGFVDRAIRAEDIKDEWDILFYQNRSELWYAEFGQDGDGELSQHWQQAIAQANQANQLQLMQFLQ